MIIGLLASFIGVGIIISVLSKKSAKADHEKERNFWARESAANNVRRKSLDGLKYIHIPLEQFPTEMLSEDFDIRECVDIIKALSTQKIVNLTGLSNTDLKLEYGTANLAPLSEYDQNYMVLVRTLQQWADKLMESGCVEEAIPLMEFAVSIETDVSRTYYQLADYWLAKGENSRIEELIQTAEKLNSTYKETIIRNLKEKVWGDVMNL